MIGARRRRGLPPPPRPAALAGLGAILVLGAILAGRPPASAAADPALAASRTAAWRAAARDLDAALGRLQMELLAARAAAREGSALLLEGDEPAGSHLRRAAAALDAAGPPAEAAAAALSRARGVARAAPATAALPSVQPPSAAGLGSMANQLRAAADASTAHLERRAAARETLLGLEAALAALDDNEPATALAHLEAAAAARQELAAWEEAPSVLPFWLDVTGRLLGAARRIAEAALAGDAAAAQAAVEDYAAAAEDGRRADVALGIALGESGAALTATPMRRLADALAATAQLRAAVAPVLQPRP